METATGIERAYAVGGRNVRRMGVRINVTQ